MSHWNGAFLINSSVDFWYQQISLRATVPGLNFLFFFCFCGGGLHGAFVAIFFVAFVILMTAPSIPFLAVCFVLAILNVDSSKVPCEMTVTHAPFKRHLGFLKCQPPIGPKCGLLTISPINQISWLLLGRSCFQGDLISDCSHPNT